MVLGIGRFYKYMTKFVTNRHIASTKIYQYMAKIGTFNALPGSQFNDNSINNTIVIPTDIDAQPLENQPDKQPVPSLKINEKDRAIIDFVRIINALAEAKPHFFLKNGKKANKKDIFTAFGSIVGLTEHDFYNHMGSAKYNNNDTDTHTAIFDELRSVSEEYFKTTK